MSNEELTPETISECKKKLLAAGVPRGVFVWPNRHYVMISQSIVHGMDYDWYMSKCNEFGILAMSKQHFLLLRKAILAEVP